jgi:hypothetical protein
MNSLKATCIVFSVILCTAIAVLANFYPVSGSTSGTGTAGSQDVMSLDRRISFLEQRFYTIESRMHQLEQFSRAPSPITQPTASDQEINLLRTQIQTLQLQLSEIECGLVKLDERTTSATVREARKNSGVSSSDPCRLNPTAPIRLSKRP